MSRHVTAGRWTLTVILLGFVWADSSWPVALMLTLLAISNEMGAWLVADQQKTIALLIERDLRERVKEALR